MKNSATIHKALRAFMAKEHKVGTTDQSENTWGIKAMKPYQAVRFHFAQIAIQDEDISHEDMDGYLDLMMFTLSDWEISELIITTSLACTIHADGLAKHTYVLQYHVAKDRVKDLTRQFAKFANMI